MRGRAGRGFAVVLLAAGVLLAATVTGGVAALVVAAVVLTVVATVVVIVRLPGHTTHPEVEVSADSLQACASYRRLTMAATLAKGSGRDWDYGVRPVLAELVEQVAAERELSTADGVAEAGYQILGDELGALADPTQSLAGGRWDSGPGRDALARILDRLESS